MTNQILIVLVSVITMALHRCSHNENVYNHTAEIVELGDNYYYQADGIESQILLNSKPGAKSKVGETIIPPEVIRYNYDERFIVAQTIDRANGKDFYKYWIVEKARKVQDSIISLDSVSFYKNIHSLQIKIKLKHR